MNPFEYLTIPDPVFGWIEWIVLVAQIVLLLVGGYLGFLYRDSHAIKQQAVQRFSYVLLALAALGTLLGLLKLGALDPFATRVWETLVIVFEVALGVYALVYSRQVYPEQVAAAQSSRTVRPSPVTRKAVASEKAAVMAPVEVPMPRAASGRRDARRERKRKKK